MCVLTHFRPKIEPEVPNLGFTIPSKVFCCAQNLSKRPVWFLERNCKIWSSGDQKHMILIVVHFNDQEDEEQINLVVLQILEKEVMDRIRHPAEELVTEQQDLF